MPDKAPMFRWEIVQSPAGALLRMQLDKNTAVELMKGMYSQVNNGKMDFVMWEFSLQGFNALFDRRTDDKLLKNDKLN